MNGAGVYACHPSELCGQSFSRYLPVSSSSQSSPAPVPHQTNSSKSSYTIIFCIEGVKERWKKKKKKWNIKWEQEELTGLPRFGSFFFTGFSSVFLVGSGSVTRESNNWEHKCNISLPVSFPDVSLSLSLSIWAQRAVRRRKKSLLSPSGGPSRFVTSHSCFALAFDQNAKRSAWQCA